MAASFEAALTPSNSSATGAEGPDDDSVTSPTCDFKNTLNQSMPS